MFILPQRLNSKPLSLFCNESLSVLKEYNIRRHHVEKHRAFGTAFPKGTEERATKVQSRLASYNRSCSTLVKTFTAQERATAALAKKKRPFTDSETVRDCMIAIFDEVIHDDKIKASVTSAVKSMPLSDTSNTRRVEILATDVFEALLSDLKKVEVMSIALDDSTDRFDTAQLCVYKLLCLLPLKGHTTGEVFFDKILSFFQDNGLDVTRVCMLVTDGALSMTGKVSGLTARWTAVAPRMTFLHCIVHQALCAKTINFSHVMDLVTKVTNLIRGGNRALSHRKFVAFLEEVNDAYGDLQMHIDIRWMRRGKCLERFFALRTELPVFLEDCVRCDTSAYCRKLQDTRLSAQTGSVQRWFLIRVSKSVTLSLLLPRHGATSCEVQLDPFFQLQKSEKGISFWRLLPESHFPLLRDFSLSMASMFGSTYICESSFSTMKHIKSKERNRLTDETLFQLMQIGSTKTDIDIQNIVQQQGRPQVSH
uniref:HAT C-terminal dimerisation domain-containing protein n=1 Tax=Stegastes partitus TaxID=144197 RepID=A0A3B4ZMJ5_9TELE